jgi:hypothetical protein
VNALEPISPELVLVDPELARVARARLPEIPLRSAPADVKTSTSVVEPSPPVMAVEVRPQLPPASVREPRHRSLSPVLLLISVFVNIVLISLAVSDARVDQPASTSSVPLRAIPQEAPVVPPTTPRRRSRAAKAPEAGRSASPQGRNRPTKGARAEAVRETTGAVERKLLAVVVQSPTGKLPRRLIDEKTGLAKNGLQATCRLSATRTFVCVVRPTRHKPREGLYVRYRPGQKGRGVFTWYPYRSG